MGKAGIGIGIVLMLFGLLYAYGTALLVSEGDTSSAMFYGEVLFSLLFPFGAYIVYRERPKRPSG